MNANEIKQFQEEFTAKIRDHLNWNSVEFNQKIEAKLRDLPIWARVAFAARCARRVQPWFKASWPGAPNKLLKAVETAVTFAEDSARTATATDTAVDTVARAASFAADRAARNSAAARKVAIVASAAARTAHASDAARAAAYFPLPILPCHAYDTARAAWEARAAWQARALAYFVDSKTVYNTDIFIVRDLERLAEASHAYSWTDSTPVDPALFGPMWPDGPPEGWPVDTTPPAPPA